MTDGAYFQRASGGDFKPLENAASNWDSGSTLRGMAVSALLARSAEEAVSELQGGARIPIGAVRWTVDLSPVRMSSCVVRSRVVRAGRRVVLIDTELHQGLSVRARSRALFSRSTPDPTTDCWLAPSVVPPLPPPSLAASSTRLHWSESEGWSADAGRHMNPARKQIWQSAVPVVEGEEPSPFQITAAAADLASLVTHWGSEGLLHINADVSMNVSRLPTEGEVGLVAVHRTEHDGVAIGTALMRDRAGDLGMSVVTSLAERGRAVDPRSRDE